MTGPASAITGPQASAGDVMAHRAVELPPEMVAGAPTGPSDRSVSRTFLANLQHLASLKDKADLVQYGIMLMVEIATLEDRITDATEAADAGWRDTVIAARTARDLGDAKLDHLRTLAPLVRDAAVSLSSNTSFTAMAAKLAELAFKLDTPAGVSWKDDG